MHAAASYGTPRRVPPSSRRMSRHQLVAILAVIQAWLFLTRGLGMLL